MPMSEAAMAGITANGHRWKFEISFNGAMSKVGDWQEGVTWAEEIEIVRQAIVKRVRAFLNHRPSLDDDMRYDLETAVEDLEMVDPEVEEIRHCLTTLYDHFDYYRVCVVR